VWVAVPAVISLYLCAIRLGPDLNVALLPTPTCSTTVLHGVKDSLVPVDNCAHFELIDSFTPAWQQVLMHLATFIQVVL